MSFEYKIELINVKPFQGELEKVLNQYSKEGWDAIQIVDRGSCRVKIDIGTIRSMAHMIYLRREQPNYS